MPGTDALGRASALEVRAWQLAFGGDWIGASEKLQEAVPHVGLEATRGYRGLLLYLAGVWLHLGAQDETQRSRARQLVREASLAADRGTWLKEMRELPGAEEVALVPEDVVAVNHVVARLRGQLKPRRTNLDLTEMQDALAEDEATKYERGLTLLGSFIGAEASKPKGQGRCDSAWVWGTAMWMTIEAKSEEHDDGLLPLKDVRQANTQLDQLAAENEGWRTPQLAARRSSCRTSWRSTRNMPQPRTPTSTSPRPGSCGRSPAMPPRSGLTSLRAQSGSPRNRHRSSTSGRS